MAKGKFTTDGKGKIDNPENKTWYHGSPHHIEVLSVGSSITRNRELAEAFSYKPTQISVNDQGKVSHNGKRKGYLYCVDEAVLPDDIGVHPSCLSDDPWEWITKKPLKLRIIENADSDIKKGNATI